MYVIIYICVYVYVYIIEYIYMDELSVLGDLVKRDRLLQSANLYFN